MVLNRVNPLTDLEDRKFQTYTLDILKQIIQEIDNKAEEMQRENQQMKFKITNSQLGGIQTGPTGVGIFTPQYQNFTQTTQSPQQPQRNFASSGNIDFSPNIDFREKFLEEQNKRAEDTYKHTMMMTQMAKQVEEAQIARLQTA